MSYCTPYLPIDILRNILKRLPVKTLLRFTVFCKSWFFLIKSADFITDHLSHTSTSTDHDRFVVQLRKLNGNEDFLFYNDNESCDQYTQFVSKDMSSWMVGDCNGVLCLIVKQDPQSCWTTMFESLIAGDVVLWNPSIRRWFCVPSPRITIATHLLKDAVLGFGFDSHANDNLAYKVVRLAYLQTNMGVVHHRPEVEVFDLRIGSWRGFNGHVPLCDASLNQHRSQFFKGSVHWIAWSEDCNKSFILSFDMHEEVFRTMLLPDPVAAASF